jgi:hypothetical protein
MDYQAMQPWPFDLKSHNTRRIQQWQSNVTIIRDETVEVTEYYMIRLL